MARDDTPQCPECNSRDTKEDEDRGEMYCLDCGSVFRSNIQEDGSGRQAYRASLKGNFETPEEYMDRQRVGRERATLAKLPGAKDPEWVDSPVIVKAKEQKSSQKVDTARRKSLKQQILDESETTLSDSREYDLHEGAMNYLDSNPGSAFDRSELFRPFYGIHDRRVSSEKSKWGLTTPDADTFVEDKGEHLKGLAAAAKHSNATFLGKVTDPHNLPGPICILLDNTNLPPRGFHVPGNIGPNGPEPFDSMGNTRRIDFEMYLDLLLIQEKPWPLHLWAEQIHLGGKIFEVLRKGGALSRQAGQYILMMHQGTITSLQVEGFVQNILDIGVIELPPQDRVEVQNEAQKILQDLQKKSILHEGKEIDLLSLLLETNCLASFKNPEDDAPKPTTFWCFNSDKQIEELNNLKLITIPIALAVSTAIAMNGISSESVIELAQTDIRHGLTNAQGVEESGGLNDCWRFMMDQIGRNPSVLFPC